jgi:hypothetical protein
MSDQDEPKDLPDPARAALDKPHISAEELEQEVGNSEPWDEASEKDFPEDDSDDTK